MLERPISKPFAIPVPNCLTLELPIMAEVNGARLPIVLKLLRPFAASKPELTGSLTTVEVVDAIKYSNP